MKTKKTPAAPVQAEERKPGKRYRGCAVLSHEGDFIFLSEDVRCETRVFFVYCHFCIFTKNATSRKSLLFPSLLSRFYSLRIIIYPRLKIVGYIADIFFAVRRVELASLPILIFCCYDRYGVADIVRMPARPNEVFWVTPC